MRTHRFVLAIALAGAGCGATGTDAGTGNPDSPTGVTASFTSLYGDYFGNCAHCHAPAAPGRTSDIEQTLDFSSRAMAYTTITTGMAAGLVGNPAGCNGVPFIGATPASSLILAVIDQPTAQMFDVPAHPSCDEATITDQTLKVGTPPSAAFIAALKDWLTAGAPNN